MLGEGNETVIFQKNREKKMLIILSRLYKQLVPPPIFVLKLRYFIASTSDAKGKKASFLFLLVRLCALKIMLSE